MKQADNNTISYRVSGVKTMTDKNLSGRDMKKILRMYGEPQRAFAKFIQKSPAFVCQTLGYASSIPLLYYDALTVFVGEENMAIARKRIDEEKREREQKRRG